MCVIIIHIVILYVDYYTYVAITYVVFICAIHFKL